MEYDTEAARHDEKDDISWMDDTLLATKQHMEAYLSEQNYIKAHPQAIARLETERLQHRHTIGSHGVDRKEKDLPAFGGHKPYPPPVLNSDWYVVDFDGHDDPLHPQNWSGRQKKTQFAIFVYISFCFTMASSLFGAASSAIQQEFDVGGEVATLGVSLFVLGYVFGPIVFGPMSELCGRRLPIIGASFLCCIFLIGVAVAKDLQTVMICRFFAGFFAASPMTVVPGALSDIYDNKVRGLAIAAFSASILCGPLVSPFIGGFITKSYLGWRWTSYLPAILGFAGTAAAVIFQKESYPPIVLVEKAKFLRSQTHNWAIHARQDEIEISFRDIMVKNIGRPLSMLVTEPIILLVTLYMGFLYGFFYLSLTAYTLVFEGVYGMVPGVAGLPQLGMIIGILIGFACIAFMNPGYIKKLEANDGEPVPEWRLVLPCIGGIVFTIGLFWFGWTGYTDSIPWIVPTLAGICLGFGIYTVFLQAVNYIMDAYLSFAASAVAANTVVRSIFGAVFPLWATYMFDGIGIQWGMTFLGCMALLFVPLPFLFYRYGKRIRGHSKFAQG